MPIEIKELVIRATVEDETTGTRNRTVTSLEDSGRLKALNDRIDELMRMIKEKNER